MANRLAREKSLYLLSHAGNPVDWYPWGAEASAEARRRDAPLFVSIGYSACHWCHVMERESFENDEIADFLNQHKTGCRCNGGQTGNKTGCTADNAGLFIADPFNNHPSNRTENCRCVRYHKGTSGKTI